MTADDFVLAIMKYADAEVIPAVNGNKLFQFFAGGSAAKLGGYIRQTVEDSAPFLQAMGIMDKDKNISKDEVKRFFDDAFAKVPTLEFNPASYVPNPIMRAIVNIKFKFTKADAEKLLSMME